MPGDGEKTTKPSDPPFIASTPANDVPYLTPASPTLTPAPNPTPGTKSAGGDDYLKPGPGTTSMAATTNANAYLLPGGGSRIVPGSGGSKTSGLQATPIAGGGRLDPVNPVSPMPAPTGTSPYLAPGVIPGKEAAAETVGGLQAPGKNRNPYSTILQLTFF